MGDHTSKPLRVVVADDHPFYRRELARSLAASGIEVAAEAPNGEIAIRAVEATNPDVVIMDLNMPGVSGLEATRRLMEHDPSIRVLVLSVSAEESDVTDALLAGAVGYVLKDRQVQELIEAIRAAAAGEARISPQLAMPLLRRLRGPAGIELDLTGVPLTVEERSVLDLVAEGRADHEIAESLGSSASAVGAVAATILMKLPPEDRVQAAERASRRGLA
jgi:DNA-binding NarL/FixJ family response regulator